MTILQLLGALQGQGPQVCQEDVLWCFRAWVTQTMGETHEGSGPTAARSSWATLPCLFPHLYDGNVRDTTSWGSLGSVEVNDAKPSKHVLAAPPCLLNSCCCSYALSKPFS